MFVPQPTGVAAADENPHHKTDGIVAAFHDLERPMADLLDPLDKLARIAAIGPYQQQAGETP